MKNFMHTTSILTLLSTTLLFADPIPGIFSTGVDDQGNLLDAAVVDPHYILISSPDPSAPGPNAYTLNPGFPVGPWVEEGPSSRWIAPQPNQVAGNLPGDYIFRLSFDLTGFDPQTAIVEGLWSADNGVRLRLNGQDTGASHGGFTTWGTFLLQTGFVPGINHLDFILNNAPPNANPTGLRVDLIGDAAPIAPNTPISIVNALVAQSARVGGVATLKVVAQGSAPVTYEWRKNGQLIEWAKGAELVLRNVTMEEAGQYTVRVSNSVNSVVSQPVTLTVKEALEVTTGRYARLTLSGSTGRNYRIDYAEPASGQLNWQTLTELVLAPNPRTVIDPDSAAKPARIYRAAKLN